MLKMLLKLKSYNFLKSSSFLVWGCFSVWFIYAKIKEKKNSELQVPIKES